MTVTAIVTYMARRRRQIRPRVSITVVIGGKAWWPLWPVMEVPFG